MVPQEPSGEDVPQTQSPSGMVPRAEVGTGSSRSHPPWSLWSLVPTPPALVPGGPRPRHRWTASLLLRWESLCPPQCLDGSLEQSRCSMNAGYPGMEAARVPKACGMKIKVLETTYSRSKGRGESCVPESPVPWTTRAPSPAALGPPPRPPRAAPAPSPSPVQSRPGLSSSQPGPLEAASSSRPASPGPSWGASAPPASPNPRHRPRPPGEVGGSPPGVRRAGGPIGACAWGGRKEPGTLLPASRFPPVGPERCSGRARTAAVGLGSLWQRGGAGGCGGRSFRRSATQRRIGDKRAEEAARVRQGERPPSGAVCATGGPLALGSFWAPVLAQLPRCPRFSHLQSGRALREPVQRTWLSSVSGRSPSSLPRWS
ncbi:translation initiation factor IF-2-like [Panthera pardus]|uniref:Translation initiation factor IF-2-like n=1 Tax=Panthera pardus TaxID=9691 RepID=A0A9W2URH3_PANPR|nr:translation initiation factor IF-2-like [Panthera pardus]